MVKVASPLLALGLGLALTLVTPEVGALAQDAVKPKIWDTPLGTRVADLPAHFVEPACGTNGGPAGLPIGSFDQFARCAIEAQTGLREIWFIYDDTLEYIARAAGDPSVIERYRATTVITVPVILSFLVDAEGRIQGYRIFTDPREEPSTRISAYQASIPFMGQLAGAWDCVNLPMGEGESPVDGLYVNERCEHEAGGVRGIAEARHYFKKGQNRNEQIGLRSTVNEFESWARVEMLSAEPVPADVLARLDAAAPDRSRPDRSFASQREAFLAAAAVDCPGCDLVGADLRYRNLEGANLAGADLQGAILHRANLRRADLSGAHAAQANFNKAEMTFATLRGANLVNALFFDANAQRADFSGANLTFSILRRAHFIASNFEEAILNVARLDEARLSNANLSRAQINGASLIRTELLRANLSGAAADKSDFSGAGLRGAILVGATLRESDFLGADLAGADLSNADFTRARLRSAILLEAKTTGTVFAEAQMPDGR